MSSKSGISGLKKDWNVVNPEVNSVPNLEDTICEGEYVRAALNMRGKEWIDFIDSLTQEQKIQLSRCWD